MSTDAIADEEELYRRIKNWDDFYKIENGRCRFSSQAFYEKHMRISVTCASLCNHDAQSVQEENSDTVIGLLTENVRDIDLQGEGEGKKPFSYVIDVEPKPLPDNPAHAEIFATPDYANKSTFKRLCEKMARLYDAGKAQLLIPPLELREEVKE